MATSLIIPVLISQYEPSVFVAKATLLSEEQTHGHTARDAFVRLERYLEKQASLGEIWAFTRLISSKYQEHSVVVRVAQREKQRVINFGPKLKIKVRCIFATDEDNQTWCSLPDWDIGFICDHERKQKSQVTEFVRQQFAGLETDDLLRRLTPMTSELREVKVKLEHRRYVDRVRYEPLDVVAEPLSLKSRRSGSGSQLAWHRDKEISQLTEHLNESVSTLLLGDTGSGKSTILRAASLKYQEGRRAKQKEHGASTPLPPLVWRTTASDLIAGMQYLGQWEARLEQVIEKLAELNAVLAVDSLVELVRLGGRSPEDSLAAFMLPYLRRKELQLVAEATDESLDACRRLLPGFSEMFRIIAVPRMNSEATKDIASRILQEANRNHRIESDDSCATTAVRLYQRYLPYLAPPKGPATLLQRMVNDVRQSKTGRIETENLLERFSRETGLPPHIIRDSVRIDPDELKKHFDSEVIGQPQATSVAVETVVKLKAGMVDPRRPVSTMLFCGPTGVGKTQLAKSIADYVLGGRKDKDAASTSKTMGIMGGMDRMVRLDMSEYQSWGAVDRLLMTSQGEPAPWIQRLRAWPLGVLLFDEFEKAAPEVFDCLLSAFDEGRITDRYGRTTTLCGTIIVLTSNVGASHSSSAGFVSNDTRRYARALEQTFRPEFLNRLDSITTFLPLGRESVRLIVQKELHAVNQRPAMRDRGLTLVWPSSLCDRLVDVGFDPALGARPLQRAVERSVVAPLAKWLLKNADATGEIPWEELA